MSKYLDRAKELRSDPVLHYNCAQSVLVPFAEAAGISEEIAMKAASNFGGGMRMASVCGAFTGGLLALGFFGVDTPAVVQAFARKLKDNHDGTLECALLLKKNKELGLEKKPHCDAMVFECVSIVEEILRENGKLA